MTTKTVGAATIGQTPRSDLIPELQCFLGADVRIVEAGVLDGMSRSQALALSKELHGQLFVTRLRDGTEVKIGEHFAVPRMVECIRRLEKQAELILVLCTGTFPHIQSPSLILYPEPALMNMVRSLAPKRIGVFTPGEEQLGFQLERWRRVVQDVTVDTASPFGPPERLEEAAMRLADRGVDLVVMDCIGYTLAMKEAVRSIVRRPVVLARSTLARVAAELLQ